MRLQLTIPGPPHGQGRPRIGRTSAGRTVAFTDLASRTYAQLIQGEWISAGRPALDGGPYSLTVRATYERPASHYRKDGESLSATGRRHPYPGKPDLSNVVKAIEDALCAVGAIPDDRHLVYVTARKFWGVQAGVEVGAESLSDEAAT